MERKPDGTDLPAFLLLGEPLFQTDSRHGVPGRQVGHVVDQIVVDVVGFQAAELLMEQTVKILIGFAFAVGQLGCKENLLAHMVLVQDFAERVLAPAINVGGVKIIHASFDRVKHQFFALRKVNADAAREAHATEAQRRELIARFWIRPVLHRILPHSHKFCGYPQCGSQAPPARPMPRRASDRKSSSCLACGGRSLPHQAGF
ncbi:hypothetical protein SDC9_177108 [bioreactor metagenome]|uniref:Uncharacterized protein n=1 Tax=bioreactor metagenome TaxID=1076179 RepID=A0A645GSE0_9ZZZZ